MGVSIRKFSREISEHFTNLMYDYIWPSIFTVIFH
jgi:hypothetical protein